MIMWPKVPRFCSRSMRSDLGEDTRNFLAAAEDFFVGQSSSLFRFAHARDGQFAALQLAARTRRIFPGRPVRPGSGA